MSDETSNASGNRWEPTDQPAEPPRADERAPAPYVPDFAVAEPVARTPWLTRTRIAVAGGAAAVLLAGGLGGFALSHATSGGGDDEEHFDRQGVPSDFDRDDDGDGRGFDDGPGFAPGDDQDSGGTHSQDS